LSDVSLAMTTAAIVAAQQTTITSTRARQPKK
jgi:hypothetical protein